MSPAKAQAFDRYFEQVRPTAFLDDATTKNVLVYQRRFSGIVDVDEVCFGDSRLTLGLTQASLLFAGFSTDYVDYWLELTGGGDEARAVVDFYSALFCVRFLSEQGQAFNKERGETDPAKIADLKTVLRELLTRI